MTGLTETQQLARELDGALSAGLERAVWPLLLPAAALVRDAQWSGTSDDGRPACVDCGRLAAYARHVCSCPTRRVLKRLGPLLDAQEATRA